MAKLRVVLARLTGWSRETVPESGQRTDIESERIEDALVAMSAEGRRYALPFANPAFRRSRQQSSRISADRSASSNSLLGRKLIPWSLAGVVAVLISLSIKLHEVVPHPHAPEEATKSWLLELGCISLLEFGVGTIVACILARTLESVLHEQSEHQHRRHIRQIRTQTLKALFGIHVEPEFYDELAGLIFRFKLRRRDFTVVYQFEPTDGMPDRIEPENKVKLTVTVSYKLSNISRRNLPYLLTHWFEMLLPDENELQDFQRLAIEVCDAKGGEDQVVWQGEALQRQLTTEGVRRIVSTRLSIPAGQTARVEFTYTIIKRAADTDIWLSTVPADGLRIIVVVDGKLQCIQFWTDPIHWDQPSLVRHVPEGRLRTYEWRINNIILPNQGILLFWRPNHGALATQPGDNKS
jgi:hypothetical protein